jgi:hypothetical protein
MLGIGVREGVALAVADRVGGLGEPGVAVGREGAPGKLVVAGGMPEAALACVPSPAGLHPLIPKISTNPKHSPTINGEESDSLPGVRELLLLGKVFHPYRCDGFKADIGALTFQDVVLP